MKKIIFLIVCFISSAFLHAQIKTVNPCTSNMDIYSDTINYNFNYLDAKIDNQQNEYGWLQYFTSDPNVYYLPGASNVSSLTTLSTTTNVLRSYPFYIGRTTTFTAAYLDITAGVGGGAAMILGIYSASTAGALAPDTLIDSWLFSDIDGTPAQPSVSNSVTLQPGLYFLAYNTNGTSTIRALTTQYGINVFGFNINSGNGQINGLTVAKTYDGTLPANYPTGSTYLTNTSIPGLYLKQ